jgi:hypothetical protein
MLTLTTCRGIVHKTVFLADDYFPSLSGSEGGADRRITGTPALIWRLHLRLIAVPGADLPYCEGDYWPGLAETKAQELIDEAIANKQIHPPVRNCSTEIV